MARAGDDQTRLGFNSLKENRCSRKFSELGCEVSNLETLSLIACLQKACRMACYCFFQSALIQTSL